MFSPAQERQRKGLGCRLLTAEELEGPRSSFANPDTHFLETRAIAGSLSVWEHKGELPRKLLQGSPPSPVPSFNRFLFSLPLSWLQATHDHRGQSSNLPVGSGA